MRALLLAAVAAAAMSSASGCEPSISYGAYECGPDKGCPSDQRCDGLSDTCVAPENAAAFHCNDADEPNDSSAGADTSIGTLACQSLGTTVDACLGDPTSDLVDVYAFTTPTMCSAPSELQVSFSYSLAYEDLQVELLGSDGTTVLGSGSDCANDASASDEDVTRCVAAPLDDGTTYYMRVTLAGSGDCDGDCAYNRYALTIRLTSR